MIGGKPRIAYLLAAAMSLALLGAARAAAQDTGGEKAPDKIPDGKSCTDCHAKLLEKRDVHYPASEDCASCHENEDDRHAFTYPLEGGALCLDCHELDLSGMVHQPAKEKKCGTCHDPHATDEPKLLRAPAMELCGKCHEDVRGPRKASAHGPFVAGLCTACHAPHAAPREKLLVREGSQLCLGCHEDLAERGGGEAAKWHPPASEDCTGCHEPHESDVSSMLKKAPPALCLDCHTETAEKMKKLPVRHKALEAGDSCAGCHDPHASPLDRLLVAESEDLCLRCHDRTYPQKKGHPLTNMKALLKDNPNHHGPIREKNCEGCHAPHGSAYARLLKKAYPPRFYAPFREENYALCFSCHKKELVEQERSKATNFRDGDRNLHYLHVHRKKKGRTCRACHEVHASRQPRHLRKTTPFGSWDLPVGYEERPDGGLCNSGCHVKREYSRKGS